MRLREKRRSLLCLLILMMTVTMVFPSTFMWKANATNFKLPISSATASSSQTGFEPAKVHDGIYNSDTNYWAALSAPSTSSPQWIKVDLGISKKIGVLELYSRPGYGPKDFTIQTSPDNSTFTTQVTVTSAKDGYYYYHWTPVTARYIRIHITSGYNNAAQIREIFVSKDRLPITIDMSAAGPDMMDFSQTTTQGFDKVVAARSQFVNLVAVPKSDDHTGYNLVPGGGNLADPANYDFSGLDTLISRFTSRGMDIQLGLVNPNKQYYPSLYSAMVNEDGATSQSTVNPFDDETVTQLKAFIKNVVQYYDSNPYIRVIDMIGPGYYGGVEIYNGDVGNPKLYAYDTYAKSKFRSWLQTKYTTLSDLNAAWGTSYASWSDVQPPYPNRTLSQDVDTRKSWSDLMFFLRGHLQTYMQSLLAEARLYTSKPIRVEIDGALIHAPMEGVESMGWTARYISGYQPMLLGNSIMDERYGPAMLAPVARIYGYKTTSDNTNIQTNKMAEDSIFSKLAKSVDAYHRVYLGSDFNAFNQSTNQWEGTDYNGTEHYYQFSDRSHRLIDMNPIPEQNEVAILNSFVTTNYRKTYKNHDYMFVYDRDQTSKYVVKPFANWARYLNNPDIIDDFVIEDGHLDKYRVLIVPNFSNTITTKSAADKIKTWVNNGGTLVAFGKGTFNYTVQNDRSVTGSDNLSDWVLGLSGGSTVANGVSVIAKVATSKPSWLNSLENRQMATLGVADTNHFKVFSAIASSATKVLEDGDGKALMVENSYGTGKVLFTTIPVSNSELFHDKYMGKLLSDYLDYRGVKRPVKFDADRFNIVYAGINEVTGKPLTIMANTADTTTGQSLFFSHSSDFDGKAAEFFATTPWRNVDGGYMTETSLTLPERKINYNVSTGSEVSLHFYDNSSFAVKSATANRKDRPGVAMNVIDGNNGKWNGWNAGNASSTNPATLTIDFGKNQTVGLVDFFPETELEDSGVVADFPFEGSDYSGWAVTGTAFGSAPNGTPHGTMKGWRGSKWADSFVGGEAAVGTLRSPDFQIQKEIFEFRKAGWDGQSGGTNNYYYLKRASDGAVLFRAQPPLSDVFQIQQWDVSAYVGDQVYFEIVDNNSSSGFAWLAADHVRFSENLDFERGNYQGWDETGDAFGWGPSSQAYGDRNLGSWQGKYYVDSFNAGAEDSHFNTSESGTGSIKSKSFIVQKDLLKFEKVGWDGQSGGTQNKYYLKRTSDNAVLFTASPPLSNSFVTQTWNVSAYKGQSVYFETVDNNSSTGYAWLGFDNVRQEDNRDFESNSFVGWTTTGTAFGNGPNSSVHGSLSGHQGSYWADSFVGGESATGTLRSNNFVITSARMSFLKAGWDGQSGGTNNYFRLRKASDNQILFSAQPPLSDAFVRETWDVSGSLGENVYFEIVDNNSSSGYAWLAMDDLEWRGTGPKAFTVKTSTDGTNYTTVLSVTNQGNVATQYSWSPVTARYAKVEATEGYSDQVKLRELIWYSPYTELSISSATANTQQTGYEASKAIDGITNDDTNCWAPSGSPSPSSPNWITLDLGSAQTIRAVQLFPRWNPVASGPLGPKDFQILTSTDNSSWTTVYTAKNNSENAVKYHFPATSARYVKLLIITGWNDASQIRELKVLK